MPRRPSRRIVKKPIQMKKKAGSDLQGPSSKLSKARVLVMESLLDQTARATADRKAPRAFTQRADPSQPCRKVFGAHHPKHSLKPHGEGSNCNDLGSGILSPMTQRTSHRPMSYVQMPAQITNIKSDSPKTTNVIVAPGRHTFTGCSRNAEKNTLTRRGLLTHYFDVRDSVLGGSQQDIDIIRITHKVVSVKLGEYPQDFPDVGTERTGRQKTPC